MALFGDIQINGSLLLRWYARRLSPVEVQSDTVCTYACTVSTRMHTSAFNLQHAYGKGAASLAAAILSHPEVIDILPPPPL